MRARAAGCASVRSQVSAAAILIIGRTGALRRYHARTDRIARRARRAEERTIGGFFHPANDCGALACRVLRRGTHCDAETALGIELPKRGLDPQSAIGQLAQAAPLEAWAQFQHIRAQAMRLEVPCAG